MPNKITTPAQERFFRAVASGKLKEPGLTPAKAREILAEEDDQGNVNRKTELKVNGRIR